MTKVFSYEEHQLYEVQKLPRELTDEQKQVLEKWLDMQSEYNAANLRRVGITPSSELYRFAVKFFNRPWVDPDYN